MEKHLLQFVQIQFQVLPDLLTQGIQKQIYGNLPIRLGISGLELLDLSLRWIVLAQLAAFQIHKRGLISVFHQSTVPVNPGHDSPAVFLHQAAAKHGNRIDLHAGMNMGIPITVSPGFEISTPLQMDGKRKECYQWQLSRKTRKMDRQGAAKQV